MDNIREWTGQNIREIYAMAENREKCRAAVQKAAQAANISTSKAG